jgi:hypothetical protein
MLEKEVAEALEAKFTEKLDTVLGYTITENSPAVCTKIKNFFPYI